MVRAVEAFYFLTTLGLLKIDSNTPAKSPIVLITSNWESGFINAPIMQRPAAAYMG